MHDRDEPDQGEINYVFALGELVRQGYQGYLGAENRPRDQGMAERRKVGLRVCYGGGLRQLRCVMMATLKEISNFAGARENSRH